MNKKLIISGGSLRPNGYELGEGKYYDKARLIQLDLETGEFSIKLSKETGGENYPEEYPNLEFTAGCLDQDNLWLPTDTEIHQYSLPDLTLKNCFSHPCFHNIHSVHVFDNQLAVTSTGLDNVVFLDKHSGDILKTVNTEGKDPWHRFDQEIDYRKIHSTRPHDSHPNFTFKLNNDVWVTRCTQEDAVNLNNTDECIDISGGSNIISVHDGLLWRDKIVFTRVDGYLVFADQSTKKITEQVDPFEQIKNRPIGWCRGLHIDGDIFYIGYSKLRKTKLKSKLKYLTKGNFKYNSGNNAMIIAYNIKTGEVINTYETPDGLIDAIYGILPFNYE